MEKGENSPEEEARAKTKSSREFGIKNQTLIWAVIWSRCGPFKLNCSTIIPFGLI
ncbi:putative L-lactate dehydrogenase A chain [Sesbania bispinosa]|nr:putative L-lactate dehydrogenase A chain [Sesbania bispinosa]